jgi:hypothetical protein
MGCVVPILIRLAALKWFSPTPSSVGTAELSSGIGPENRAAFPEGQKLRRTFVI